VTGAHELTRLTPPRTAAVDREIESLALFLGLEVDVNED
jgi:hypothetical protein